MKNFSNYLETNFVFESWRMQISSIIISAILLSYIAHYLLSYAKKISNSTSNIWDDAIIKATKLPLIFFIWLVAIKLCADILTTKFYGKEFLVTIFATKIAAIICLTWFVLRLINYITQDFAESRKVANSEFDRATIDIILKIAKLIAIILAALMIVQSLGFSVSGVLAAGGAGGLVIGFAAKDLFANFFGGLTIYLDRPFSVGDWIRCDEKHIEGTVEHIGWRHTRLRAFSMNPIYVPNSVFTTLVVENPSRMTNRRIKEVVGIRYCDIDKVSAITAEIKKMLEDHFEIDQGCLTMVNFDKFNDFSLDLSIYAFTKTINWQEYRKVKQDVLLKVAKIVADNGAEFAFPMHASPVENKQYE